jgi:Carboxypeptidase regulatory-like domain
MTLRHWAIAVVVVVASIALGACRQGIPTIDPGPKPPTQEGTIAGHVSTDGNVAVVSRVVRAVPAAGGKPYEATTNEAGTYTMKVPPGRYRLEVELRPGERIVKEPVETEINPSDLDPDRDFVITVAR